MNGDRQKGELESEVAAAFGPPKKNRKPGLIWIVLALAGALAVGMLVGATLLTGETNAADQERIFYTCGMHPEVVQDEPGYCPQCTMKLTPMKPQKKRKKIVTGDAACQGKEILHYQAPMDPNYRSPEPGKSPMGMDLVPACESNEEEAVGGIYIDPRIRQNMGIRTARVTIGPLVKHIRTVGHVDYDERQMAIINTKIDGWVERLYVDFTGQKVKRGQRLLSIYSPKLISTQEELLLALRQYRASQTTRSKALLRAAERRLQYWDISTSQIERIKESGKVQRTLAIYSPINGVVVHKNVMEGKFVKSGMDLFRIADLSRIWVYVHVYEMDAPFVKEGQEVSIELPHAPELGVEKGKVDYVFPWLDKKTRDIKARLVFDNEAGQLKPEMYATVTIHADLGRKALLADSSAVIRSGVRNVVFVETEPGTYEPRTVELGAELEDAVEIEKGLSEGEKVVVNGQFMLDSESRLKEALQKFKKPEEAQEPEESKHEHEKQVHKDPATALKELEDKGCTHTCPMPEHFYICGQGPEKCPDCGMTLQLIEQLKKQFGGEP